MTERTQATVLLLCVALLLRLAHGSDLLHFARPGVRPLLSIAGVLIASLAGLRLLMTSHRGRRAVTVPAPVSRAGLLILAPMLVLVLVAPPALGALTANHRAGVPPRPSGGLSPLPAGNPATITIGDVVVRTVWDGGRTLRGRTLRMIGFVSRTVPGGFVLTRLVITCCAADAEPMSVDAVTRGAAPPANTWLAVTGRFAGPSPVGPDVPAIDVLAARPITAPADPYET